MSSIARRPQTALQAVKSFRNAELVGLMDHLQIFGPLPEPPESANAKPSNGATPISLPNPFIPWRNPKTKRWQEARVSLRRQADLVKKAHATGTLGLLPPGPKKSAFELRVRRLEAFAAAAPLPVGGEVAEVEAVTEENPVKKAAEKPKWVPLSNLKAQVRNLNKELEVMQEENRTLLLSARADEAGLSRRTEEPEKLEQRKARTKQRAQLKKLIPRKEATLAAVQSTLNRRLANIEKYGEEYDAKPIKGEGFTFTSLTEPSAVEAKAPKIDWDIPVRWAGDYVEKKAAGADLGIRLYAAKKRMFKGHLWERTRTKRIKKQAVLMRDMAARVKAYKEYYKKRKPNPLKPSRYTKPPKLPF